MGGGSSSFQKQEIIDPKPSTDMNVGISVAGSQGCASCQISFDLGSTSSLVTASREDDPTSLKNRIILSPSTPFTLTFNGRRAVFRNLYLYYPAPLRVEGVQADAVLQGVDGDNIMVFIPLMSSGVGGDFLQTISSRLNPSAEGLGKADKDGKFATIAIPTGQDFSLTKLVSAKDPYFTWMNGKLEQYVIADSTLFKHIGWRSTNGAQVIYFQNPVPIISSDIQKLTIAVGPVIPGDVLSSVTDPLYSAGQANCKTPLPKAKMPTFKLSGISEGFISFLFLLAVFMGIIVAVALVLSPDSFVYKIGRNLGGWFDSFGKRT
jgi:hypothetical protein